MPSSLYLYLFFCYNFFFLKYNESHIKILLQEGYMILFLFWGSSGYWSKRVIAFFTVNLHWESTFCFVIGYWRGWGLIKVGFSLSLSLSSEASLFDSSTVCLLNHSLHLPFVFYTVSNMSVCVFVVDNVIVGGFDSYMGFGHWCLVHWTLK